VYNRLQFRSVVLGEPTAFFIFHSCYSFFMDRNIDGICNWCSVMDGILRLFKASSTWGSFRGTAFDPNTSSIPGRPTSSWQLS